MKRLVSNYEKACRSIPCGKCGAKRKQPCRTPSGRATSAHRVRDEFIRVAYYYGYLDGLEDAINFPKIVEGQYEFFKKTMEEM